ncbi:MAG: hypothetical protein HGB23_05170 [Chlorobiaceae bacterium]|nr:hypothetical protein [Chlorobiaceae bacterium]
MIEAYERLLDFSGAVAVYDQQGNIFLKVLKERGKRITLNQSKKHVSGFFSHREKIGEKFRSRLSSG